MTRASTPGSLSTSTAIVWRSIVSLSGNGRASDEDHALFGYRLFRLVGRAEQHLVMRRARRDHREAVLRLVDHDIEDDSARLLEHLLDRVIQFVRPLDAQTLRAEGIGELDEIRQRRRVALGIAAA